MYLPTFPRVCLQVLTAAIFEKCSQSFLIELKIYVSFNSKKNLRAQIKNRKPLTIGTLAPLLLFNMFLLHRSLSQHLKITLSDDRPVSVSLANVVVAYRFHGTLFLKNPVTSSIWNFSIKFKL